MGFLANARNDRVLGGNREELAIRRANRQLFHLLNKNEMSFRTYPALREK
jgi:hypothetical protein